jgi:hypothetical protein
VQCCCDDLLVRTVTPIVDYGYATEQIKPMIAFQHLQTAKKKSKDPPETDYVFV